jgi:hypothetical protein
MNKPADQSRAHKAKLEQTFQDREQEQKANQTQADDQQRMAQDSLNNFFHL